MVDVAIFFFQIIPIFRPQIALPDTGLTPASIRFTFPYWRPKRYTNFPIFPSAMQGPIVHLT